MKPLIGEYPSDETIENIKKIAEEMNIDNIDLNLHHFHIHTYGDHSEITFHMRFPKDMTVFDAHLKATIFENAIREKLSIEPTIHIEAYK